MTEWISVEDSLPDYGKVVPVKNDGWEGEGYYMPGIWTCVTSDIDESIYSDNTIYVADWRDDPPTEET